MTLSLLDWRPPAPTTDRVSVPRRPAREVSIDERFAAFHKEHPIVFTRMLEMARADLAAGKRRLGVKALWERLRETLHIEHGGQYKLNNSYTSRFADLLITTDPRLAEVIEVRRRKA